MVQQTPHPAGRQHGGPVISKHLEGSLDDLLEREWLISNGLGGYASGTVIGCPTRRYHGTLIWSRMPPLQRLVTLASTLEQLVTADGKTIDLSTFEFSGAVHPQGYKLLTDFDYETAPPEPWVQFTWQVGDVKVTKRITLQHEDPRCRITWEVMPDGCGLHHLRVRPLLPMRDFHHLRRRPGGSPFALEFMPNAVHVGSSQDSTVSLCMAATGPMAEQTQFAEAPDWWYNFLYRKDAERQMDWGEDLYSPGWFSIQGEGPLVLEITAVPGAEGVVDGARRAWLAPAEQPGEAWRVSGPREAKLLARAARQFVVQRHTTTGRSMLTILAGYHWFGDWGRDTAIAIPGILMCTGRFAEARDVLTTFAEHQHNGLIPNVFDDRGAGCAHNSVDASLWFVRAVEQLAELTGDDSIWQGTLGAAVRSTVEAFCAGTDFDIRGRDDGLISCGNADTQLTWMDAKFEGRAMTPRHGMPVEINALWLHALQVASDRAAGGADEALVKRWADLAKKGRKRFAELFWFERGGYLYDVIRDDFFDASLRPNQAIALALPDCPLPIDKQRRALQAIENHLLTPYGLRTLAPGHPDYHPRYQGSWGERDAAYHQGTVWPWPMGPFIEAYLRVHEYNEPARQQARAWLEPLLIHLESAGCLGSINEIFDADPPHKPRGAVAQAWSVSEVLRALLMTMPPESVGKPANGYYARRIITGIPQELLP